MGDRLVANLATRVIFPIHTHTLSVGRRAQFACPMDDVDRYRKQAEECRQQAEKAISLLDKLAWLKVAGEWIKLAQDAETRPRRD